MKATVLVRLKGEVLDPQGRAVHGALEKQGFDNVKGVRIGKLIEIELTEGGKRSKEELRAELAKMADAMLANPVIEDYEILV
jgi:phosphoribosylformylglycinamidine synthase